MSLSRWGEGTRSLVKRWTGTRVASPSWARSLPTSSASVRWVSWTFPISWSWRRASCARLRRCARPCARSSARCCSTSSRTPRSSRWTCYRCFSQITRSPQWATRIRRFTAGGGPRPRPWSLSWSVSRRACPTRGRRSRCQLPGVTTCRSWTLRTGWRRLCVRCPPSRWASSSSRRSLPFWFPGVGPGPEPSTLLSRRTTTRRWERWSISCSGCARSLSRPASSAALRC